MKAKPFYLFSQSALVTLAIVFAANTGRSQAVSAGTSAIQPITQSIETGPILDVVPYVLSDGYTINLALIPSLTDFNGYDTAPTIPGITGGLNVVSVPVILPNFTVRQVVTTVNVWDNQTVVIGGLISSQVQSTKDKVPIIGDVPMFGRLFQSANRAKKSTPHTAHCFVTPDSPVARDTSYWSNKCFDFKPSSRTL